MPTTIQFHLDENIDHAVARGLRLRGIDATTTADAALISATDDAHVDFAGTERRIILTHDPDFLRLHDSGVKHAGIIFCQKGSHSVGEMIQFLCLVHDCLTPEEMQGQVEFL